MQNERGRTTVGATLTDNFYTVEACVCLYQRSVCRMELSVAAGRKAVLDLLSRFKANLEKKGAQTTNDSGGRRGTVRRLQDITAL